MRYKVYISLAAVAVVASIVTLVCGAKAWCGAAVAAVALPLLLLAYRAVVKPLEAVQNGICLIKAEDFGSKLRPTGQADADKVVYLFNSMMQSLRDERLKSREQERFLSQLIAVMPTGIAICSFDGTIERTNKAWQTLVDDAMLTCIFGLAPASSVTLRLSGSVIVRCSRLWFMDRGFRRTFFLAEPVTEVVADAEKQMFNRAIRTIGHEVNNTMGSVLSVLESIEADTGDDMLAAAAIRGSRERCDNLVRFVRAYADIAKLPPAEPMPTDLDSWLECLMPSLQSLVPPNITLEYDRGPAFMPVDIDTMLMERVMTNIIKNSVESIADRPEGHITVAVEGRDIVVSDNGAGISPEAADRLFTPFFSTKHPDRGLGLMLVSDILRSHRALFSLTTDPSSGLTSFRMSFR